MIGAGYGDEGKGLVVDWLAKNCPERVVVVRFNGGAQAGHTVNWRDDRGEYSNVYHHLGSATLRRGATILSRHFITNPTLFFKEVMELRSKFGKVNIDVMVDPRSLVTTPYDIFINQALENKRGNSRHGSCGLGINETMLRSKEPGCKLTVADLRLGASVFLERIQAHYERRCCALNIEPNMLLMREAEKRFIADCADFVKVVKILDDTSAVNSFNNVIFEGAQGLLLDKWAPDFPHVTNSNTGIKNVLEIVGNKPLEIYYVSRTYLTRHGNGPLVNEIQPPVIDETNCPNAYQGTIRYGKLNLDLLERVARNEKEQLSNTGGNYNVNLVLTHADVHSVSKDTWKRMAKILAAKSVHLVHDKFSEKVTEV